MTIFQKKKLNSWINFNENETYRLNTAKADRRMPHSTNDLKLQTTIP